MYERKNERPVPRNWQTLVAAIVARISGCANQKERSLDDQVDDGRNESAALYDGPTEFCTKWRRSPKVWSMVPLELIHTAVRGRPLPLTTRLLSFVFQSTPP